MKQNGMGERLARKPGAARRRAETRTANEIACIARIRLTKKAFNLLDSARTSPVVQRIHMLAMGIPEWILPLVTKRQLVITSPGAYRPKYELVLYFDLSFAQAKRAIKSDVMLEAAPR